MTKRIKPTNFLQSLLIGKGFTIKELKAEVVLIMCHTLLINYIHDEKESKENGQKDDLITEEENSQIFEFMEKLFIYLNQNILSYPRIQEILANASNSKEATTKAKLIEPYAYFYNTVVNSFISRLDYVTALDEKQKYIPDLLVLSLILSYKEKAGASSFKKFEFVDKIDFTQLNEIYLKVQSKEKEKQNIKINTHIKEQTLIRKMRHISSFMVDKLIDTKYKY